MTAQGVSCLAFWVSWMMFCRHANIGIWFRANNIISHIEYDCIYTIFIYMWWLNITTLPAISSSVIVSREAIPRIFKTCYTIILYLICPAIYCTENSHSNRLQFLFRPPTLPRGQTAFSWDVHRSHVIHAAMSSVAEILRVLDPEKLTVPYTVPIQPGVLFPLVGWLIEGLESFAHCRNRSWWWGRMVY